MADGRTKVYTELERYMEKHAEEVKNPQDVNRLVEAFMAAHGRAAGTGGQGKDPDRRKEPVHADAASSLLQAKQNAVDADDLCERLKLAESSVRGSLTEDGYFSDEKAGSFWLNLKTRDYICLRREYMMSLMRCGKLRRAVQEGQELLRLCEEDGPGVRFVLMHLYAMLEEPEPMERLHEEYDNYDETGMLLPLSVAYYRTGNREKAAEYLERLAAVNPGTEEFVKHLQAGDVMPEAQRLPALPFTPEELSEDCRQYPEFYALAHGWIYFASKKFGFPNE